MPVAAFAHTTQADSELQWVAVGTRLAEWT